jgi:hypothetical protein
VMTVSKSSTVIFFSDASRVMPALSANLG